MGLTHLEIEVNKQDLISFCKFTDKLAQHGQKRFMFAEIQRKDGEKYTFEDYIKTLQAVYDSIFKNEGCTNEGTVENNEKYPQYEVSTMGRIRNIQTGYILKAYNDGKGYLRVKLNGDNCRVHILVAKAFIPNPESKPVVNHKRGKKNDPRASQLEWTTLSENTKHAWDNGFIGRGLKGAKRKAL